MKKVNLLSREELKKVQGGGPPFTSWWVTCKNFDDQEMGVPFEVSDCTTAGYNWQSLCSSNGYPAAASHTCTGGW